MTASNSPQGTTRPTLLPGGARPPGLSAGKATTCKRPILFVIATALLLLNCQLFDRASQSDVAKDFDIDRRESIFLAAGACNRP
jgi:hypothetical protein